MLESAFREHHGLKTRTLARAAIVLGVLLYASFGPLDALMAPDQTGALWAIRYAMVCPLGLVLLAVSFTSWGQNKLQLLTSTGVIAAGLGIVAMTSMVSPKVAEAYYVGLILTLMVGFTVAQLRWVAAVAMGGTIVAAYEMVAFRDLTPTLLINNNFFLMPGVIIGLIACWELERFHRRDFLQLREIHEQRRALSEANQRLREEAARDPLTGLHNRRHLEERLEDTAALARRYGIPTSMVLIDLDRFKRVNDTLGHPVGDELLRRVATSLLASVRETDQVFRIGGDEFLVLLRGTPLEDALDAARRMEKALTQQFAEGPWQDLALGTSTGVALVDPAQSVARNLEDVDRSLYTVKDPERR